MLSKALWMKEWKQAKVLIFLMAILFAIQYPITAILQIQGLRENVALGWEAEAFYTIQLVFSGSISSIFLTVLVVALAVTLMGMERNTRRLDFAFSLPFKRRTIFLTKWLFGVFWLTVCLLIFFFTAYFIFQASEFSSYLSELSLFQLFFMPWLSYIAMYSFALFIGTIAGEMFSQFLLTGIFTIFPLGFVVLLYGFLQVNFNVSFDYFPLSQTLMEFIWPTYLFSAIGSSDLNATIPIVATVLFVLGGMVLYERNEAEYNGEFLIFKQLHGFFAGGIILCFALLGGMAFYSLLPYQVMSGLGVFFYWIGALLFAFLAYLLVKRLFSMNLRLKTK